MKPASINAAAWFFTIWGNFYETLWLSMSPTINNYRCGFVSTYQLATLEQLFSQLKGSKFFMYSSKWNPRSGLRQTFCCYQRKHLWVNPASAQAPEQFLLRYYCAHCRGGGYCTNLLFSPLSSSCYKSITSSCTLYRMKYWIMFYNYWCPLLTKNVNAAVYKQEGQLTFNAIDFKRL